MPEAPSFALTLFDGLREIVLRLTNAARITHAAIACAQAGAEEEPVEIVLDCERSTDEANKRLAAVTLLNRLRRECLGET